MLLAHDQIGTSSKRVVLLLHGILGSRNNWRSFARKLVDARPEWSVLLVDARNHGDSHGFSAPHDLAACADDLQALLAGIAHEQLVLAGHSFGGKVVLELARRELPRLAEVWVLDSPPGTRPSGRGMEEIDRVLRAVSAVELDRLPTRQALVPALGALGLSERLAMWMTTNLKNRANGGFEWKFELAHIPEMLRSFGESDYWPFVLAHRGAPKLVMVRGGKSDRWSTDDLAKLAKLEHHVFEGSGHWLHTDEPERLLDLMTRPL